MKWFLVFIMVSVCNFCLAQQKGDNSDENVCWADSISVYKEQERRGSAEAYLKLARCYCMGLGVEPDFSWVAQMGLMAMEYGCKDPGRLIFQDLLEDLPARLLYEMLYDSTHEQYDQAERKAQRLATMGLPSNTILQANNAMVHSQQQEALTLLKERQEPD